MTSLHVFELKKFCRSTVTSVFKFTDFLLYFSDLAAGSKNVKKVVDVKVFKKCSCSLNTGTQYSPKHTHTFQRAPLIASVNCEVLVYGPAE